MRVGRGQCVVEVQRPAHDEGGLALEPATNVFPGRVWRLTDEWAAPDGFRADARRAVAR